MSRKLTCGWSTDYLSKKLYLEKKVCRQFNVKWGTQTPVIMTDFSAFWPCQSDATPTAFTCSLFFFLVFFFSGVSNGGPCQLEACYSELSRGQKNITRGCWQLLRLYVCLFKGQSSSHASKQILYTRYVLFQNILSNDNSTPQCKTPKKYREDADS